ncbi:MAG: hypothetical protein WB566_06855 [Terriglobales bacterium]
MDDLDALERLSARIENLEHRVCTLEHPSATASSVSSAAAILASRSASPRISAQAVPFIKDAGVFSVLGKAMLGIAGAYVLRAVAESGSFPKLAVVVLALAYAGTWLVWATRVPANAVFSGTVYASTAALIMAPMLWELTLRFDVLPTAVTAGVLSASLVTAYVLGWKRRLTSVVLVTSFAVVLTTLALLIATHDLVPFVSALLFMALAGEVAAGCNRWLGIRALLAVAADLAVWILLYIYSGAESARSVYKSVATPILLALGCIPFLIYGASIVFRTTRLRHNINVFEIGQTVIVSLLAAFGILRFGAGTGAIVLGVLCLLFSAACYALAYAYFDRYHEERNYHVYATWSGALFLAGSSLCLSRLPLALSLSAAAIVGTLLGVQANRLTLQFHGLAYLAAAAYAAGLLDYAGRALAGTFPAVPGWIVWIVAASAVLCYAVGGHFRTERWNQRLLQLLSALLAVAAVITFLVSVLVWLAAVGMTPGASQVAIIRTLITCAVALALAFGGSRWQRTELVWIAYGILALVTAKLLFEDLQHGHPGSTAVSIFLYAVALILVPRMARVGRRV